ncbi:NACHT domain-containing protein [Rugamonas aquatica]|uniref:NACHT domain-containing protein n=1 Tax=Rugamonas aquatica TaxID=2743357 RepID=A0A6A7MUM4_9BURK|nr:NACHT domain-containing protein [Rugamonas aquatica]MQA36645.1 NACHT domain-containing protein [Rugamonas aquatica]
MNSKNIGNSFRDHVLNLLKSKFLDAHTEGKAAWKNADIIFSMMELGKRIKVAVECKNYNRALNTTDFSKILSDYHVALENGEVNLLLVISNKSIEATSRQFIEKARTLRFMTIADLERWLVGLQPYVEALADEFISDEIHQYYVEGRFEGVEGTAFENVQEWIYSPMIDDTGLAILGGYGLGKSSLAKRLASEQASRYLNDPENERLPILLPLGQVVHETELAGLFGKHFTSRYSLESYSYKALMHLNSAGRLLIILDGFDEMKHAMTEHDFRSNFREFNKLRIPGSKVLLLGRPNAFTSESSKLLIRGLSKIGDQFFQNSDFPAWKERKLCFFNVTEQEIFLNGFLKSKNTVMTNTSVRLSRIAEVIQDIDDEILQRPVQTRIVGLLAADPNYTFKGTSRFRLYQDFVRQVIQRDQEKRARSFIPAEHRRLFLCRLAWWSWTRPGIQGTFIREEVPNYLLDGLSDGQAIDILAKRTEYLVSSLTEEKDSNFLYFAHRSFHEFLVSSYITEFDNLKYGDVIELGSAINDEIADFLLESKEDRYLIEIYRVLSEKSVLSQNPRISKLLSSCNYLIKNISEKTNAQITPLDVLIMRNSESKQENTENTRNWLGKIIVSGKNASADCAGLLFFEMLYLNPENQAEIASEFLSKCWQRVLSGLNEVDEDGNSHTENMGVAGNGILFIRPSKLGLLGGALQKQTRKIKLLKDNLVLINAREIYAILNNGIKKLGYSEMEERKEKNLIELRLSSITNGMSEINRKKLEEIYAVKGDEFKLERGRERSKKKRDLNDDEI